MYRNTYVEINCDKLENNIKKIIKTYNGYKYYFGVVKNNAYNHGIECIKYMIKSGINYLCVATLEEALEIRKIDKNIPILVLEPIELNAIKDAFSNDITITIDDRNQFDKLLKSKLKGKFHIKINSGMNRFGLNNKEDVAYIVNNSNNNLINEGIYSHLSNGILYSEEYKKAIAKFIELTSLIDLNKIPIVHLDRSLTMEQHDKIPFANGVRLGIIMYGFANPGYYPSVKVKIFNTLKFKKTIVINPKLKLESIFSFKTEVIKINKIKKGEIVGYSGMYKAKEDQTIALLPYGYADYLYNNLTEVCINNKLYSTIAINMDVTFIKIDDTVKVGDMVEIFGDIITTRKKAENTNTNIYKLLASVSNRVPRIYISKDKRYEIKY